MRNTNGLRSASCNGHGNGYFLSLQVSLLFSRVANSMKTKYALPDLFSHPRQRIAAVGGKELKSRSYGYSMAFDKLLPVNTRVNRSIQMQKSQFSN